MNSLWLQLSEDSELPARWSAEAKKRLLQIYDPANPQSAWSRSLRILGYRNEPEVTPLIRWSGETAYVCYSALLMSVSCGTQEVVPDTHGWKFRSRGTIAALKGIFPLMRAQWQVESYLAPRLRPNAMLPETLDEKILESSALGLATLALTMRLPRHRPEELARWLALPELAPARVRRTVALLAKTQLRRTALSGAWKQLFADDGAGKMAAAEDAPPFLWDDPFVSALETAAASESLQSWQGLPVCPGKVRGPACIGPAQGDGAWILVFPRATPETVEHYGSALAVVYLQGGVLAHACTVARERGIPCVTGVGKLFLQALNKNPAAWIEVDGAAGTVTACSRPETP